MTIKPVIHKYGNGALVSKLRLIADEGMALTNDGFTYWACVDTDCVDEWYETSIEDIAIEDSEE